MHGLMRVRMHELVRVRMHELMRVRCSSVSTQCYQISHSTSKPGDGQL